MTNRIKGLVVTLEADIRDDDAECIINAVSMIRGVIGVSMNVRKIDDTINRQRVTHEMKQKLYKVFEGTHGKD